MVSAVTKVGVAPVATIDARAAGAAALSVKSLTVSDLRGHADGRSSVGT
jgi:hypothetical protein